MKIVIDQLARMPAPSISVAGINRGKERHIRPITGVKPLARHHLWSEGGVFELGAVVELGEVKAHPRPPESENLWFHPHQAKREKRLEADEYLKLVDEHAEDELEAIFGPALVRHEWNYAVDEDEGERSLGCLRVQTPPDLGIDRYGNVGLRLNDLEKPAYVPVADLRFLEVDHKTARTDVVEDVRERIAKGVSVRLMLGLRRFKVAGDDRRRHWLEVNGVCLEDSPLGDRP